MSQLGGAANSCGVNLHDGTRCIKEFGSGSLSHCIIYGPRFRFLGGLYVVLLVIAVDSTVDKGIPYSFSANAFQTERRCCSSTSDEILIAERGSERDE